MKKKISVVLLTVCLAACFSACGSKDDVKVISKENVTDSGNDSSVSSQKEEDEKEDKNSNEDSAELSQEEKGVVQAGEDGGDGENSDVNGTVEAEDKKQEEAVKLSGYVFEAQGTSGTVYMTTDIEAATVVETLGEADSYFESPSCAFDGVNKIYTYPHFEIDTYPDGKDKISMILLLDDLVSTPEGLCIGMTKEDMEKAYGTGYEESNGAYVYTKDNMKLIFLISDDEIYSIEYDSMVLEEN